VRELALTATVDAGTTTIHLRNEYSAAATAWMLECHGEAIRGQQWTSQWQWSDEELGLQGKPIERGKETEVRISPPRAMPVYESPNPCSNYRVMAAAFADGTVSGDLRWINAIATERQKANQNIAKATDLLRKAIADETDRAAVIEQLVTWWKEESPQSQPGRPAANYGKSTGWRSKKAAPGLTPLPDMSPPAAGPLSRAAVPGVTLWLIQEKQKDLPDVIKLLSEWQERLDPWKPAVGTDERRLPILRTGNPSPPWPEPDLLNKPAPDFRLKDVDGRELALKDLRGRTVFLDFWATWCEPCRKEMPDIKALQEEFKDKGLVVVCINFSESAVTARKYFAEQQYPFRNLLDPAQQATDQYGAHSIPLVVLIDKDGVVRYVQQGYRIGLDFRGELKKLGI
jgi:peroxiredoxin